MGENNFQIMLQAVLDKIKSAANIKESIKAIELKLPKIKLHGTLNKTEVKKELNTKLKTINPKVKIDADTALAEKKMKRLNQQKSNPTITPTVDNSQVVSGLKQAQKETKTLWERFTNGIFGINLIRMGVQEVVQAVRQAVANIKELDAIKTNIQMVSGTSDPGVNAMMSSYNSMAKDLSSTTKDVAEAANEFLRMGESVASTNELIKSSQVLSKVGMIESAESASYLISSLKGYKIAAEDSMDVVSKLTSVDLEAAVSAGGLAEALSKCANIADNSGVSINRLIGYTATVGETTQKSMSEVGNSFQALLSRMNNIKIGRFIDDETGESLSDTEAVLNKLGIQLRDTEDTYRSFDAVLDDIGSRWKDFSKVEQNAISVAIAGTRQRENFEALMNNYGNALKYAETAANSAGSALERYGIYQDSIQAKTNELTAAMESLSTGAVSEELYSGIIEAATGVVEFIDKTNILKGTLAGLAAMGISKTIASIGAGFITAAKSTAQLTAAMALFDKEKSADNLRDIGEMCKGLSDKQLRLIMSTKGLKTADRELILEGMGVAESEREQTLTTLGFATAEDKATISTFSLKGAFNSLRTAIATNPIGVIITAVSVATTVFSVYKQHQEEVRQATEEAANAYKESTSSIEDYTSRYEELHKALIAAKGNEEETYEIKKQLLGLQTELNDKFGEECGTLDLVTNAYESQTEAIRNLNKEKAQLFLNENKEGIDKAEKEMTKDRHYNLSYTGLTSNSEKGEVIKELAEKYKEQGITLLDEYGDGTYLQFSIHLNADAQSAYETINAFENDLRDKAKELGDEHMFDDVLDVSSDSLNKAKETIENYGDTYKQALTAEIVSDDDKSKTYGEALKAVEAYNEAVLRSENPYDDQNVTQAKENLDAIKTSIQDNEAEWGKYSVLFDDVFGQADTRLLEFNEVLKTDSGLKELANDLEGLSDIDLQALNENVGENNSFDKLKEAAAGYKVNVDELIAALVRLGYVQGEVQGTGADTADFTDPAISLSISQTIDQLNTQLKPAFDSLKSAYQDIYNDDGVFDLKSIDILSTCDSIKSKLDELNEIDGIRVDYASFENLVNVLSNTESTEKQVEDAFDSLADSITEAALNGTEDFNTMKSVLENLGLENGELVAFDALISNTKALKEAGLDLANASDAQIQAFANESVSAENTAQAYNMLTFHKELCNLQEMNTAGEVANLKTLAENAGYTGEVIQYLTEMEQIYQEVASGTLTPTQIGFKLARAVALKAMIEGAASKVQYAPKMDWSGAVKDAGKAGRDSGKSYKDKLKEELSDLESVISGITGRIDDQISSVNEQKSAALESIDAQKEALESAKESAVSALEAERDARLEVIETQKAQREEEIKLIEKQIKSKQDEIKSIEDAAAARAREISLQEKEYALEQKRNQRTKLVYTESSGMVYRPDEQGMRKAKEEVDEAKRQIEIANIQKEIDLLEDQKDLLNEQITLLDEQADAVNKYYDEQIKQTEKYYDNLLKNLEKQRKETEAYYESITKSLEQRKEKFQELTEILEKAELSAKLKQLNIDEEALLNGSEEEFEKLKNAYMDIVFKLNEGNDEVLNKLRELSGYEGTAPTMLEESNTKLGTMNDELGNANTEVGNVNSSLTETASTTSDVATNVSDANTNISESVGLVNDEKGAFDDLKQTIDLIIEAISQKTKAIEAEQNTVANAVESEMANFQLLINKILEVKEKLDEVNNTVTTMDRQPIDNLTNAFQLLYDKVLLVSNLLGASAEGEGAVSGISGAIQALNEISLEEGIIAQFTNLKTAIDQVTAAISGGGGESSEGSSFGGGSGSKSGKQSGSGNKGGKGSEGESGSGNSLTGAIEAMGETTKEVIGEPDAEGDGTVIGEFGSMETAVNDVRDAIGTEGSGGEGGGSGSGGETDDTLVGSIEYLGDKTEEVLGEPGGEGAIGRFEQFKQPIQEADGHVQSINKGLDEIDGKEVECTIKINVETSGGGIPGAVGAGMNLGSATYEAKYLGNAHYEGTALASGNWAVQSNEDSVLVGEVGYEIIVRNGRFFTVGDTGPEMFPIKKGDIVFNHEQSVELLKNGHTSGRGKAYEDGTVGGGKFLRNGQIYEPVSLAEYIQTLRERSGNNSKQTNNNQVNPNDKTQEKLEKTLTDVDHDLKELLAPTHIVAENMERLLGINANGGNTNNISSIVNNNRNVQQSIIQGGINITCPGVTSQEVAKQVGVEVDRIFNGMHLEAEQRSRMR